jgi:protease-4
MEFIRESIFISSIRSFFKSFAAILGIFLAFIPICFLFYSSSSGYDTPIKNKAIIFSDADGNKKILPANTPVILRLDIHGQIGFKYLDATTVENQLNEAKERWINTNRLKAILLHINTPGGTVIDSDAIYRMLVAFREKYKLPIYAYVDGLCASGGMYVASCAHRIEASPISVIGSVGVIMGPFFNVVEGLNKLGIKALNITDGKNKDMMSPFRNWEKDEDKCLKAITSYMFNHFVDIVTMNRKTLSKEKLIKEYGAQVFDAPKACEFGYIDNGNSCYEKTLKNLLKAAKMDEKAPYQVVGFKVKKSFLSELMEEKFSFLNKKPTSLFYYLYNP